MSLYFLKYVFMNFYLRVIFFSCTWIPQIIFNAMNSAREPLNFKYILITTLGKLAFPVRIKPFNNHFSYT